MHAKQNIQVLCQFAGLFFLILFMASCAGKSSVPRGLWIAKNDRIVLLDAGPHKGNWQTRDLTIEYTYQQETQNLQIFGVVTLGNFLTMGFTTLNYLTLDIYALDPDGLVLNSKSIPILGHRRSIDSRLKMTFDNRFILPSNTAAITFGYRGRVTEGGRQPGDQIDWNFWKGPGHKPIK